MMNDSISRQAAIDAICNDWCGTSNADCKNPFNPENDEYYYCDGCGDVQLIKELPSVQPEQKKGEWIRNNNGTYSCSLCQSWISKEQYHYAQYCLYCGANMRSKDNG